MFADRLDQTTDKVYYSMKSQDDDDDDYNDNDNDTELSYYSLAHILKSTKDFSDENKLGEGGFGSVYMVTTLTNCRKII